MGSENNPYFLTPISRNKGQNLTPNSEIGVRFLPLFFDRLAEGSVFHAVFHISGEAKIDVDHPTLSAEEGGELFAPFSSPLIGDTISWRRPSKRSWSRSGS